jgi:hypothetical protein
MGNFRSGICDCPALASARKVQSSMLTFVWMHRFADKGAPRSLPRWGSCHGHCLLGAFLAQGS